ncbi:hypothetical protein KSP39_PZI018380 [Platanthera zijinensis]|uniref:Uncharacterized protein n=1 Tax=Platanthera zijinensis TaxID=2320716 RepID=A0AAP0B3Y0_9ASPA
MEFRKGKEGHVVATRSALATSLQIRRRRCSSAAGDPSLSQTSKGTKYFSTAGSLDQADSGNAFFLTSLLIVERGGSAANLGEITNLSVFSSGSHLFYPPPRRICVGSATAILSKRSSHPDFVALPDLVSKLLNLCVKRRKRSSISRYRGRSRF